MPIILLALPYLCHTRDVFIPLLYHPIRGLLHFEAYMLSPYHVLHKSPKAYNIYILYSYCIIYSYHTTLEALPQTMHRSHELNSMHI